MFSESAMVGQSRPGKEDMPRRACWVKLVSHQHEKSGRSTNASSLAHMTGETTTSPNAPAGGGDDADDCRGRSLWSQYHRAGDREHPRRVPADDAGAIPARTTKSERLTSVGTLTS
jgi:hypothetical protein